MAGIKGIGAGTAPYFTGPPDRVVEVVCRSSRIAAARGRKTREVYGALREVAGAGDGEPLELDDGTWGHVASWLDEWEALARRDDEWHEAPCGEGSAR